MKIIRSIAKHGTILPRADAAIRGIPIKYLHHEAHVLKHPLSAYKTSLTRISAAWAEVFPLLHKLRFEVMSGSEHQSYPTVLAAYEGLLYRLNEHIDVAYEVLRSLREPTGKQFRAHEQFLNVVKLPGYTRFRQQVHEQYRVPLVGAMVNLLKHDSAQLRAICGQTDNDILLGFFVDGPRPGGFIGPNPKVHRKFGRFETAFTFTRDMLLHLWWVYRIGDLLGDSIEATLLQDHGHHLVAAPGAGAMSGWGSICLECSRIRPAFFVDECAKPYPLVVVPPDMSLISLEFPAPIRAIDHRFMNARVLMSVTETNRAFVMPYMQRSPQRRSA